MHVQALRRMEQFFDGIKPYKVEHTRHQTGSHMLSTEGSLYTQSGHGGNSNCHTQKEKVPICMG